MERVYFTERMRKGKAFFIVKPLNFIECVWEVVHDQIQEHLVGIVFLCEKIMMDFDAVWVMELFDDNEFSVGIFWILVDSLYRNFFTVSLAFRFINYTEGALSYYLYPLICFTFVFIFLFFGFMFSFGMCLLTGIFQGGEK